MRTVASSYCPTARLYGKLRIELSFLTIALALTATAARAATITFSENSMGRLFVESDEDLPNGSPPLKAFVPLAVADENGLNGFPRKATFTLPLPNAVDISGMVYLIDPPESATPGQVSDSLQVTIKNQDVTFIFGSVPSAAPALKNCLSYMEPLGDAPVLVTQISELAKDGSSCIPNQSFSFSGAANLAVEIQSPESKASPEPAAALLVAVSIAACMILRNRLTATCRRNSA